MFKNFNWGDLVIFVLLILIMWWALVTIDPAKAQTATRSAEVSVMTLPTKDVDGNTLTNPVLLNYYQSLNGGAFAKVVSKTTDKKRVFDGLPFGEVCYYLTAETVVNPEGGPSETACKSFAYPAVSKPPKPTVQ